MEYSQGIQFETSIINMKETQELTRNNQPKKSNISSAGVAPPSTHRLLQRIALWDLQLEMSKNRPWRWRCLSRQPIFYSTFPADAPSSKFSPFPASSATRNFLSSYADASSAAFFPLYLDSAIPKADFLAFIIASPTGQSFEVTR